MKRYQERKKEESLQSFNERNKEVVKRCQERKKEESPQSFINRNKEAAKNCRKKKNEEIGQVERLNRFNKSVLFGPIFICCSCSRKLYENGVTKIKKEFKDTLNNSKLGSCILREVTVDI